MFSFIWLIDRTLLGATTSGHSGLGVMAVKRYSAFPKTSALLEVHYSWFSVISRTLIWGILPLCRDAVTGFYTPSRLDWALSLLNLFVRDHPRCLY